MQKKAIIEAFTRALDELGDAPKHVANGIDQRRVTFGDMTAVIQLNEAGKVEFFHFHTEAHVTRQQEARERAANAFGASC